MNRARSNWISKLLRRSSNENEQPSAAAPENPAQPAKADGKAVSADAPIQRPEQDVYGINEFAKAIAKSISTANTEEGLVFAINGPWGSGKSSACNLVLRHLETDIQAGRIVPIAFNPWWFSGTEALTLSFFQELSVPISKSIPEHAKQILASLGRRISPVASLLEPLATVLGAPGGAGALAAAASQSAASISDKTVEEQHAKLSEALRAQPKTFLVLIDDIDRLGTDEALQIFKLVRSVGKLPRVVYLLAFDRALAEKMISERFPSEGASYLDKFIQGGFDLPLPDNHDLRNTLLEVVEKVMGSPEQEKVTRFFNLFYDICAPLLKLPRDVVRLSNAIRVAWPAVSGDVDRADFLAIETLRLFLPSVHRAIRSHPDLLCGLASQNGGNRNGLDTEYNETFLDGLNSRDKQIAKHALLRLFPRTEAIWSNTYYSDGEGWSRDRLVCSKKHFSTYFGFSVDDEAVATNEFQSLLDVAADAAKVAKLFREAASQQRRRGGSRAALLLEELQVQSQTIPEADIEPLLSGLFAAADDLYLVDQSRGFDMSNNQLRIHWLLNGLLRDRLDQNRRGQIIEAACLDAALGWLVNLSSRCSRDHEPADTQREGSEREPFVSADVSARVRTQTTQRIRDSAARGDLVKHSELDSLLFRWRELANEAEVKQWTDARLADDEFIVSFAGKSIQHSWSQGMGMFGLGDRVAQRNEYVNLEPYRNLLDIERFRARVDELLARQDLSQDARQILERYKATPERDPRMR